MSITDTSKYPACQLHANYMPTACQLHVNPKWGNNKCENNKRHQLLANCHKTQLGNDTRHAVLLHASMTVGNQKSIVHKVQETRNPNPLKYNMDIV